MHEWCMYYVCVFVSVYVYGGEMGSGAHEHRWRPEEDIGCPDCYSPPCFLSQSPPLKAG